MILPLINFLYHNRVVSTVFHTSVHCLQRELRGCASVLDLGCGPDSPLKHCNVSYSVGVDGFPEYLRASKASKIHSDYTCVDLLSADFPARSFDAVIMIEVLEHLEKEQGLELLRKAQSWARKKVIVSMPNGFVPQGEMSGNPLQVHRSGWLVQEMRSAGFRAYGMAGWKVLRKDNDSSVMEEQGALFSTIRYRPKVFWMAISELTQLLTYYFPEHAFGVLYVKEVE